MMRHHADGATTDDGFAGEPRASRPASYDEFTEALNMAFGGGLAGDAGADAGGFDLRGWPAAPGGGSSAPSSAPAPPSFGEKHDDLLANFSEAQIFAMCASGAMEAHSHAAGHGDSGDFGAPELGPTSSPARRRPPPRRPPRCQALLARRSLASTTTARRSRCRRAP